MRSHTVIVPVGMFPDIKRLTSKQRDEWMILDDQYGCFTLDDFLDALSKSETMTITYQTASGEVSMAALHGQTFREQIKDCPRLKTILDEQIKTK